MNPRALILILGLAAATSLPIHGVVLELRDHESVSDPNLCLNDLLQSSQGLSADDLSAVITVAPSLGKSATWTRDQIQKILPAPLKDQTIEWSGATTCTISRPAAQYAEADVRQAVTDEITRHLPAQSTFQILEIPEMQEPFLIPDGKPDLSVELAPGSLRNEWGRATLQFSTEGQVVVVKSVRFHWSYTRKVWRTAGRIPNGRTLTADAFEQIDADILKLPGLLQPALDFPNGKVAARLLPEGKILMQNDWVEPVLVARDDLVTVRYDRHGVSITVQARALANGTRDEIIQVQNLSSRKIFNARVVDERTLVYEE